MDPNTPKQPSLICSPMTCRGMSRPFDKDPPQNPQNGPANLPSIKTGYAIVVFSVLFFLIVGYATFFSAFISSPPNSVRDLDNIPPRCQLSDRGKGFESRSRRHSLQVPRTTLDPHLFLLCHRQLGGLAILPELLNRNGPSANLECVTNGMQ